MNIGLNVICLNSDLDCVKVTLGKFRESASNLMQCCEKITPYWKDNYCSQIEIILQCDDFDIDRMGDLLREISGDDKLQMAFGDGCVEISDLSSLEVIKQGQGRTFLTGYITR